MNNYPDYISEKRKPVATPEFLIEKGQAIFGTFDSQIPNLNMLSCKEPAGKLLPRFLTKLRLSEWEAFEVMLDEGVLLAAVYKMGVIGFSIFVFFDRNEKKTYSWVNFAPISKCKVAPNLINSITSLQTGKSNLIIENQFQDGIARAEGYSKNKKSGSIEFKMECVRVSPPSVVSIPFGENKPLYSEKDFFKAQGYIIVNGRKLETNHRSTVIIDDHKGFYPFKMHYHWLTTMGKTNIDGKERYLAINFTRNQSLNQDDFNENILWLEDSSHPIPPVRFEIINKGKWRVVDDHNTVDVIFEIDGDYKMMVHLGLIDVSYTLPFGKVSGFVHDTAGNKYIVDGMYGIGEDKSTRL